MKAASSRPRQDLKPHNVLVSGAGVLKIADFGLARPVVREGGAVTPSVSTRRELCRSLYVIPSPSHISPESLPQTVMRHKQNKPPAVQLTPRTQVVPRSRGALRLGGLRPGGGHLGAGVHRRGAPRLRPAFPGGGRRRPTEEGTRHGVSRSYPRRTLLSTLTTWVDRIICPHSVCKHD